MDASVISFLIRKQDFKDKIKKWVWAKLAQTIARTERFSALLGSWPFSLHLEIKNWPNTSRTSILSLKPMYVHSIYSICTYSLFMVLISTLEIQNSLAIKTEMVIIFFTKKSKNRVSSRLWAKIRVSQVFWEPIKNRVSPRSALLEALYLEALLYICN